MLLRNGNGLLTLFGLIVMVFKCSVRRLAATAVILLCLPLHAAASVLWGG
jgi:hypothetical protein